MSNLNVKELIAKIKEVTYNGLPFMEGKEKGELTMGKVYTITNYGYLTGDDGDFICFITKEEPQEFYFGGSILTDSFNKLENTFSEDEMATLLNTGIEVVFTKKKSKNKREYTACEFFPSEDYSEE